MQTIRRGEYGIQPRSPGSVRSNAHDKHKAQYAMGFNRESDCHYTIGYHVEGGEPHDIQLAECYSYDVAKLIASAPDMRALLLRMVNDRNAWRNDTIGTTEYELAMRHNIDDALRLLSITEEAA